MASKTVDAQAVALAELARAVTDPTPRLLLGTAKVPCFFKGSTQAVKAAARLCEERQWLVPTGEMTGKGAGRKPLYRLSPAGVAAVLEHGETSVLLRGLAATVQEQTQALGCMQKGLEQMQASRQPLAEAVAQLARRVEPPDVEAILRRLQAASPSSPPPVAAPAATDWLDEIVRMATEQQQRDRFQPATLPQLYEHLIRSRPGLTIGQFHDGLRQLRDRGRVRLTPYTRSLAAIADAKAAMFLDGEVVYYVELP